MQVGLPPGPRPRIEAAVRGKDSSLVHRNQGRRKRGVFAPSPPDFGRSTHPILTEEDYAQHTTTCSPGFLDPPPALQKHYSTLLRVQIDPYK